MNYVPFTLKFDILITRGKKHSGILEKTKRPHRNLAIAKMKRRYDSRGVCHTQLCQWGTFRGPKSSKRPYALLIP